MSVADKNTRYYSTPVWATPNFYASVYLILKGAEIVGVEKSKDNSGRSIFIFKDFPQRKELLRQFNFAPEDSPETLIDFRKAIAVIRDLKQKLYQERLANL